MQRFWSDATPQHWHLRYAAVSFRQQKKPRAMPGLELPEIQENQYLATIGPPKR
jgi:hypothetical protein